MAPGPTFEQLITTIRQDAASDDPVEQLVTAVGVASDLEEVADAALAHFVDQCRRAGRSWTEISKALGVTKQAAHKRFASAPALDHFTLRAKAILTQAVTEAVRLGHDRVDTEHLLLALYADPDSLASRVLAEARLGQRAIESTVLAIVPRGRSTEEAPPFTPDATNCLTKSIGEALQLGHNYVGTEHLLLALFDNPDTVAAKVLEEAGATYDDIRRRVTAHLSAIVAARSR
jgi:hypothetical protein